MTRTNPSWHPVRLESAQLLAGYQAARHLQPLDLPPRLAKDLAGYLCLVQGELAQRQIPTVREPEPDHYDEMDDAELAMQARALRIGIVTLPADHPRRALLRAEWESRMSELARRTIP
jgi:hypothetical protein